ncbi:MAG: tRNA preQ1(34) S-adenosylmethionine ribosyltransferase-isomerase QueA [Betaproteobacteria bacterium]|nr:tRNA preQ1(34) S-adenosylmethionine ribosyltransferase-isomerase QueA [Betaproteobacteria bacterium]
MRLSEFDFELPPELIAQHPAARRGDSRLLHVEGDGGGMVDRQFSDLPGLVRAGDVMVFNDSAVIKARLLGHKDSGGKAEVLIEHIQADGHSATAHVRASKSPRPGSRLVFADGIDAKVIGREDDLFVLDFGARRVLEVTEAIGAVPLPPYISHAPSQDDAARYQTVYANAPGSVAAPTAGLHFDAAMRESLAGLGVELVHVTLHVGAGTFQPVRGDDIDAHVMHREWYSVSEQAAETVNRARREGRRVTAVGTTSLRTLESAARDGQLAAGAGDTRLFIRPGYGFQLVDRLITNFHLPKSTLMMLVSAFAGTDTIRRAYAHAIGQRYRFFSYGDAMLLERSH